MGDDLRGRVDPSDVVQQALLQAVRGWEQFQGGTLAERIVWLRRILGRTLANFRRDQQAQKRDVRREGMQARLDQSAARLESLLPADGTSPSRGAARAENCYGLPTPWKTSRRSNAKPSRGDTCGAIPWPISPPR